jgi:Ran GTPase-activating protein (RanGAP) involved in mRNA processing and transport
LQGVPLRDADLRVLSASPTLPPLWGLSLEGTQLTGATLPGLLGRLGQLETLSLSSNNGFDGRRLGEALAALNPTAFRELHAYQIPFGRAGMQALADARGFTGLTALWLRGCSFDAAAMEALAEATHLMAVRDLHLGDDRLSAAGGVALAAWPGLRAVRNLELDHSGIAAPGAEALARSPHLGPLAQLRLRANGIGDAGAKALAASERLSGLRELDLTDNAITASGVQALATSPHLARLRHLALDRNALGDEGAAALADSPHIRSLRWLTLGSAGVSRTAGRRLVEQLPELTAFLADGGFLQAEHLEAIREGLAAGGSEDDVNAAFEARLVQGILDAPDDMEARQSYSDFLRDTNCPWWLVILLQDPDGWRPEEVIQRWRGWFEAGRTEWLAPLLPWAQLFDDSESFDRGFLRKVWFNKPLPDDVARSLARFPPLALLPLEVLRGHMYGEGAFQVLACRPELARMTRLDFRSISAAELRHVLGSPHLTALEELSFGCCRLSDEAARLLAGSPSVARLRSLDLGRLPEDGAWDGDAANRIGPDGLAALGASPHLSRLRSLGLLGNRTVGDAGVRALLAAPHLCGLTELDLRSTGLTVAGVRALADSPWSASLRTLRLGGLDALGDDVLEALASSSHLAALHELDFSGFRNVAGTHALPATDAGARALAASKRLAGLRVLRASCWTGLTDDGFRALRDRLGSGVTTD